MKKSLLLPILALLLITACEKEQSITTETQPAKVETKQDLKSVGISVEARTNDVWLCHKPDGQNPVSIWVDASSVEAHLAHGDVLLDADGDGYTAVNTCGEGTMNDCDDANPAIHPGAEEVPGNGLDDDCDPNTPDGCPVISPLLLVTLPDGSCLYVNPTDNSIQWGGYGTNTALPDYITGDAANTEFSGEANTQAIVNALGAGTYAAQKCADLVEYGYDDWYLPAAGELNAMYQQLGPTTNGFGGSGQITDGWYWSSTEGNAIYAWAKNFDYGGQFGDSKNNSDTRCRCVRR